MDKIEKSGLQGQLVHQLQCICLASQRIVEFAQSSGDYSHQGLVASAAAIFQGLVPTCPHLTSYLYHRIQCHHEKNGVGDLQPIRQDTLTAV